jgi:uncharacterized protein YjiS (DUF1127 family)
LEQETEMAELAIALRRHAGGGIAAGAATRIATAWKGFRRRMRAQDTIGQLRSLDDRTLKDIGLHRSEILSVGWSGFDRLPRR